MRKNHNAKVTAKTFLPKEEYIEMLSMKSNEVSISKSNGKTGSCCNDLAFPTVTCREDAPCKLNGQCYCMHGMQTTSNVQQAYLRNLRLYNTDIEDFWQQIEFKVRHCPMPLFRFFDCGDFPNQEFVKGSCLLAKKFPEIKFLAYTKHYEWVNEYLDQGGEIPDNYVIRFSMWHNQWKVPNPHNLPVAWVDFKDKTLNPDFPKNCVSCANQLDKTITCSTCRICWKKNIQNVKFKQH